MAEREPSELWAPDDGTDWVGMVHTQMRRATYYRGEQVIAERTWCDHGLFEAPTLIGADYDRVVVRHLWRKPAPLVDRAIKLLEKLAPDELR